MKYLKYQISKTVTLSLRRVSVRSTYCVVTETLRRLRVTVFLTPIFLMGVLPCPCAAENTLITGPKPKPIKPPSRAEIETAMRRGVDLLLKIQNKDGSWGSAHNTKGMNIYAPVPGAHHAFQSAVTALCVSAMIELDDKRPAATNSIERGEAWLMKFLPQLRRATPMAIYNVWGHSYGIQALVRMRARRPDDKGRIFEIDELIKQQIELLERYSVVNGGWGYYDFKIKTQRPAGSPTSFTTATALVALAEAKKIGYGASGDVTPKAIAAVKRQMNPDGSYLYGEYLKYYPRYSINRPAGSLGRSQACNIALRKWGEEKITDKMIKVWLDRLFARNNWLSNGRKRPIPHEAPFGVAGYFFYYGHYYAALCIEALPEKDRPHFQDHLARLMVDLQEKDGSWWDYPLYNYHQQYGTAMALMSLKRCLK